jgi:hypothetical protein
MSFSQAAICNLALGHLGMSATIDDFDADESTAGLACRTHWDIAVGTALRAIHWPFAKRVVSLATVSGYDSEVWNYAYRAPSDYVRASGVNLTRDDPVGEDYEIGGDSSGHTVLTDAEDAVLTYTSRVVNTGLYPDAFVDVLAYALAIRLAQPLTAAESYRQAARQGYRTALGIAMADVGNETVRRPNDDGPFVAAREGLADG